MPADASSVVGVRAGSVAAWLAAMRPRSLLVAVGPVLVGTAFAARRSGAVDIGVFLAILAAAILIQVVCNLQNDVGYTVRGGERGGTRTGLPRATAQGWLSVGAVRSAIVICTLIAIGLGLTLVWVRGWPVVALGGASLLAAVAYMGGPKPIAYTPFGELTVFLFFGLVAVVGTDWVLTGKVGIATVAAGGATGALAAAALAVNNHRDIGHDAEVGRRTFAVTFGARASQHLFAALLFMSFALCAAMAGFAGAPALLLPGVLLPSAAKLKLDFDRCAPGLAFNDILFRTFLLGLQFSVLLAAGAILDHVFGAR
jgi:1,4-dihydroxy-2-naphthoate octaprenyltransferase